MKSTFAAAALAVGAAFAAPVVEVARRAPATDIDATVLNFALTLEHLENAFYMEALAKFPQAAFNAVGSIARFRFNIAEISYDETTHVDFLTTALTAAKVTPVPACEYDFGLTDVTSFIQLARTLEGVGVSAYLGAAALITSPEYLTAAGSILTIEARHNAYFRDNQKPDPESPFPFPFETPLDPTQVYTLASAFITSCPPAAKLPFTAFPSLTAGPLTLYPARAGQNVYLRTTNFTLPSETLYCAWPAIAGPYFTDATVDQDGTRATCKVPSGVAGQAYAILSTNGTAITDAQTVAGPAIVAVQAPYTYPGFPM